MQHLSISASAFNWIRSATENVDTVSAKMRLRIPQITRLGELTGAGNAARGIVPYIHLVIDTKRAHENELSAVWKTNSTGNQSFPADAVQHTANTIISYEGQTLGSSIGG